MLIRARQEVDVEARQAFVARHNVTCDRGVGVAYVRKVVYVVYRRSYVESLVLHGYLHGHLNGALPGLTARLQARLSVPIC